MDLRYAVFLEALAWLDNCGIHVHFIGSASFGI